MRWDLVPLETRVTRVLEIVDRISLKEIQFTVRALNRERASGIVRVLVSLSKNEAREYIKGCPTSLHDPIAIDQIELIINLSGSLELRTFLCSKEI